MSDQSVVEVMQAIRALHPGANVSVDLRAPISADDVEWSMVTVSALPDTTFGEEPERGGEYPNLWRGHADYLAVNRYKDGDLGAALATALDLIAARSAVSA